MFVIYKTIRENVDLDCDQIMFIMCLSDEKFKKKFEANSIQLKKLLLDKEIEMTFDLFKDSYVRLIYCMEKINIQKPSKIKKYILELN